MTKRTQASPMLFRTAKITVVRAKDEKGEPDITVALSSDTPIERTDWWGDRWVEILDHSKGAIDLARAKDGLPLLLNHNTNEQVGRIENLRADTDGVLRGTLRFSRSALGQEVLNDVLDGIRVETSVGYTIQERKEEQEKGKILTIRATKWMPMEGSLVAVPADHTVGVGRSNEPVAETRTMKPDEQAPPAPTPPATGGEDLAAKERKRVSELRALRKAHPRIPETKLDGWIDNGVSVDDAREAVLKSYEGGTEAGFTGGGDKPAVSTEDLERGRYSLSRAILAATDPAAARKTAPFEMEVHDEILKKRGPMQKGQIYVPLNLWVNTAGAARALRELSEQERLYFQRGAHEVATASKGGELKFTEPGPFIELLRNRLFTRALGARVLTGLQGDLQFPRQTGAHTLSWVGESPTADLGESNMTMDNLNLAPKLASSTTSYTRKLLAQGVVDIDNLIRDDFVQIFAVGMDFAGIRGPGTSGEPRGILATNGIGSVTGGAAGLAPTYNHFVDLETEVAIDNADLGSLAYLTNPKVRGIMKKVSAISATTGIPAWFQGEVNGYRAEASNNVPSNLTKGTSTTICSAIIFGNWTELIYGIWGDMEIVVDPYTRARRGDILVTPYMMLDTGLRHPQSFAAMQDALAG